MSMEVYVEGEWVPYASQDPADVGGLVAPQYDWFVWEAKTDAGVVAGHAATFAEAKDAANLAIRAHVEHVQTRADRDEARAHLAAIGRIVDEWGRSHSDEWHASDLPMDCTHPGDALYAIHLVLTRKHAVRAKLPQLFPKGVEP